MSCLLRCISACCWLPYVLDCETRARRPGIFLDVSTCRNRFNWLMPRPKERKEEFPRGSLQLNSHDGMASQQSPTPCQIRPGSFVEYDFSQIHDPRLYIGPVMRVICYTIQFQRVARTPAHLSDCRTQSHGVVYPPTPMYSPSVRCRLRFSSSSAW